MRSLRLPWWAWSGLLVAVLVVAALSEQGDPGGSGAPDRAGGSADDRVVVVGDIGDGDSFRLEDGERIRMIGIDTPEVDEGECFATEARDALRELLPRGTAIRLRFDEERTDRFGRTLAYVHRDADDLFVNLELVRLGYAEPLVVPPNVAHADEIAASSSDALAERLGRWGACDG
jgi:micrococcal nuclease